MIYGVNMKKINKDFKPYVEKQSNGLWHYIDNTVIGLYTDEEIKEINKKDLKHQESFHSKIEADGYIRFPVFALNNYDELVEKHTYIHPNFEPSCSEGFLEKHGIKYNIYIPSYKRAKDSRTVKMLQEHGIENYYLCVDPDQYEEYLKYHEPKHIIIRDWTFRNNDMIELGSSVKVPHNMHSHSPLTNGVFNFSKSIGEERAWFMDDDIIGMAMKAHKGTEMWDGESGDYNKDDFYRCSHIKPEYGFSLKELLRMMENIQEKTRNAWMTGFEKFGPIFHLPISFKFNTKIYTMYLSNNLLDRNDTKHIARQNNDVATSVKALKQGYVNQEFKGIYYNSEPTQAGGGQTEMFRKLGTYDKAKNLIQVAPNCAKITYRYSRPHHTCDYTIYSSGNAKSNRGQRMVGAIKKNEE